MKIHIKISSYYTFYQIFLYYISLTYLFLFLFFIQQWAKKILVLYDFMIFELNIIIEISINATNCFSMVYSLYGILEGQLLENDSFQMYKLNNGIIKIKTFDKQPRRLQIMRCVVYMYQLYFACLIFNTHVFGVVFVTLSIWILSFLF